MDPKVFKIIGGKLYLNWDTQGRKDFEADASTNIQKADAAWRALIEK